MKGPVAIRRTFFFLANTARASSEKPGAMTASTNISAMVAAVSPSTSRFRPITPPNALVGSQSRAATYASRGVAARATPHGLLCLMMQQAGSSKARTTSSAASRSTMLLYESSLPWSCSARATEVSSLSSCA